MRAFLRFTGLILLTAGLIPASGHADGLRDVNSPAAQSEATVSNLKFTSIDGKPMPLSDYAGKTLLIVNSASKCGFTPQYAKLQEIYATYKDRGLVVIAVPSNDFGNQEPDDEQHIKSFVDKEFHITFPLTSKEVVSGESAHPFFKLVRAQLGVFATPKWNFYKYLITPEGRIAGWWSSKTSPTDKDLLEAIEANLPKR